MPRVPKKTPHARHRRPVFATDASVVHTSHDEKHALIHAHAHVRHAARQKWVFGYAVGVVASFLVVATGWWMTLGTNIRVATREASPSPLEIIKEQSKDFKTVTASASKKKAELDATVETVKAQYQAAKLQAEALRRTAEQLKSVTSTIR